MRESTTKLGQPQPTKSAPAQTTPERRQQLQGASSNGSFCSRSKAVGASSTPRSGPADHKGLAGDRRDGHDYRDAAHLICGEHTVPTCTHARSPPRQFVIMLWVHSEMLTTIDSRIDSNHKRTQPGDQPDTPYSSRTIIDFAATQVAPCPSSTRTRSLLSENHNPSLAVPLLPWKNHHY